MDNTALDEFRDVLSDFRQLSSLGLKGAIAAPIANIFLRAGPPPTGLLSVLTSIAMLLAVVWVFQFWYSDEGPKLATRMKTTLVVLCISLIGTLALVQWFTVLPADDRDRVVEGFQVRSDVKPLLGPTLTPEQALAGSRYDPETIWTKESIAVMRATLTVGWLMAFSCLSLYIAAFIVLQRRRHAVVAVE